MRNILSTIFSSTLVRDYVVASMVFAVLAIFAVHAVTGLIDSTRQNVRIETAEIKQPPVERNYQIARSVIDDTVMTGSTTSRRPVILDPCTGAVKAK